MPVIDDVEEKKEAAEKLVKSWGKQGGEATNKAMKLKASTVCARASELLVNSEAVKTTTTSHRYEKMMLKIKT